MAAYDFSPGSRFEVCKLATDNVGRVFEIIKVFLDKRDERKLIVWRWIKDHKTYEDNRNGGTTNEDWFIEKLSNGQISVHTEESFDIRSSRLDEVE